MDNAFRTAPYPAYTTMQLLIFIKEPQQLNAATVAKMQAEVDRRARVDAGDRSVMTPSERLRAIRDEG
jgi:hypothetical protein